MYLLNNKIFLNELFIVLIKREEEFSDRLIARATFKGFTALHYAVLSRNKDSVKALLDAGANPTIENEAGHRAVDYAYMDKDIEELLIKHAIKYDEMLQVKVNIYFIKILKY
jgi:ATP-dependent Clp protease ATP-binding subunit ClpB